MKLYSYIKIYFILFLILQFNSLLAQNTESINKLKFEINNCQSDSLKSELYISLAQSYQNKPDSTIFYYNQALLIALLNNDKEIASKVLRYIGISYYLQGLYDKAIEYYIRAYSLAIEINDSLAMFKNLNNMGLAYSYKGNFNTSLKHYFKSLAIIEKLKDSVNLASSFNNIGNVYVNLKEYNKALDYYFKALKIREKYNNERGLAECYNNIGNAFFENKNFIEAEKFYGSSLRLAIKNDEKNNQSAVYSNLGAIFYEQNQFEKAKQYFILSLKISKIINDNHSISTALGNICEVLISQERYSEAIVYGEQSVEIAKKLGVLTTQKIIFGRLARAYSQINNYNKAYEYHVMFKNMNDSIFNQKNKDNIKQLEYQYLIDKKELEVENLKKEKKIAEINLEKEKYFKRFFIIGFILLSLTVILGFWVYKIKQKTSKLITEQRDEILMMNEELRQQKEEILMQTHELEKINLYLEDRIAEEVEKNREKDIMLSLKSRQAEMGEMIGNIAHQWRQPLSSLAIMIQNLKVTYDYNELTPEYVTQKTERSMELIKFMSQTIDDFRNFFKPEKEAKIFNVNESILKALLFFEINLKNLKIDIAKNFSENINAFGFVNEFMQVLLVILNNAKDVITERAILNPVINISTYQISESQIEIQIADNAGGISQDNIEKIFNVYFTTKDNNNGTGIGLYMAKNIIEKNMNGSLTAINKENGVIFIIKLNCIQF